MKTINLNANPQWLSVVIIILSLVSATSATAGPKHHKGAKWAKVTLVEPITRRVERRIPEERCWDNREAYYDEYRGERNSYSSAIVGGIIGGAIGNAVGHKKKNKQVGTAVGALLGATIGHDIGTTGGRHHSPKRRYHPKKRCEVSHHVSYEEEVIAYRVWYRYKGEEYQTRMRHKPGKRIRVRVSVEPI